MCSQPPKEINDDYLVDEILEAIPLIDRDTKYLGLTGGEATLLGEKFIEILQTLKNHLPETTIDTLTNGRNFKDFTFARKVSEVNHPSLTFRRLRNS